MIICLFHIKTCTSKLAIPNSNKIIMYTGIVKYSNNMISTTSNNIFWVSLLLLQIFMFLFPNMLPMDVIWSLRNRITLWDSFNHVIFAYCSWLLHHFWASFSTWTSSYGCNWLCLLFNSFRSHNFHTVLLSKFYLTAQFILLNCANP